MNPVKNEIITLAHGGGGIKTQDIIKDIILRHLNNPILERLDDSACITVPESELVFSTDSYVVNPVFFPGGDIGKLAACGTINDLAMQGAEPKCLSMGLILEEGFLLSDLETVIQSMGAVLKETGISVVTGDTKVVERGKGSGVFINTTGIGIRNPQIDVHVSNAKPGDVIILTGTMGDHGIAVMSTREGLKFETELKSDVAPLWEMVSLLLREVPAIHSLRDPTRGGIAAALCDIAEVSGNGIRIRESSLPIKKEVQGACNLLGLDPLNVANEGKAVVVCPKQDSSRALGILQSHPLGKDASVIGRVVSEHRGMVILETKLGGERIVEMPSGEDLPRIC
jgi:hydrogenase expression/formation protein HypE